MSASDLVNTHPRLSPLTRDEVVEWLRARTRSEVAALIDALEEALGASLPRLPAPQLHGTSNPPEYTEADLILTAIGPDRILVLKEIRRVTGWSLVETRDSLDRLPLTILEAMLEERARALASALQALGAAVAVRLDGR